LSFRVEAIDEDDIVRCWAIARKLGKGGGYDFF